MLPLKERAATEETGRLGVLCNAAPAGTSWWQQGVCPQASSWQVQLQGMSPRLIRLPKLFVKRPNNCQPVISAATFMEHWKRKQMRLNYRWDLTGFEEEEVCPFLSDFLLSAAALQVPPCPEPPDIGSWGA